MRLSDILGKYVPLSPLKKMLFPARNLRFQVPRKHISNIDQSAFSKQYKLLCHYCYMFSNDFDTLKIAYRIPHQLRQELKKKSFFYKRKDCNVKPGGRRFRYYIALSQIYSSL
jgi:hypothetical protein